MTGKVTKIEKDAATALAALGNVTRLKLFRLLVQTGPDGLNVGDIVGQLSIPGSTAAHHIQTLERAGLIRQERRGREIICRPDFDATAALVGFVTDNCCAGACPGLVASRMEKAS